MTIDNLNAGRDAARHLVELGHRRIGYIGNRYGLQADMERFSGYRQVLEETDIGFQPELVAHGDGRPEGGMSAMERLLALPEPPTFLYYGNARAGAPQYDIALVAPRLLAAEKSIATLAKEEALTPAGWAERAGAPRSRNVIFWVALGAVVVVLLVVIGRLLPKQP